MNTKFNKFVHHVSIVKSSLSYGKRSSCDKRYQYFSLSDNYSVLLSYCATFFGRVRSGLWPTGHGASFLQLSSKRYSAPLFFALVLQSWIPGGFFAGQRGDGTSPARLAEFGILIAPLPVAFYRTGHLH